MTIELTAVELMTLYHALQNRLVALRIESAKKQQTKADATLLKECIFQAQNLKIKLVEEFKKQATK